MERVAEAEIRADRRRNVAAMVACRGPVGRAAVGSGIVDEASVDEEGVEEEEVITPANRMWGLVELLPPDRAAWRGGGGRGMLGACKTGRGRAGIVGLWFEGKNAAAYGKMDDGILLKLSWGLGMGTPRRRIAGRARFVAVLCPLACAALLLENRGWGASWCC